MKLASSGLFCGELFAKPLRNPFDCGLTSGESPDIPLNSLVCRKRSMISVLTYLLSWLLDMFTIFFMPFV